jgi:ribonuclease E
MLIDASHREETRVVVVKGNRLEDFDFESEHKKQIRGNIYLAKVTRVEPSLQAAFVDYGGNRHGFLAFSEIHPDYYQIPLADRQALLAEEARLAEQEQEDDDNDNAGDSRSSSSSSSSSSSRDASAADAATAPTGAISRGSQRFRMPNPSPWTRSSPLGKKPRPPTPTRRKTTMHPPMTATTRRTRWPRARSTTAM